MKDKKLYFDFSTAHDTTYDTQILSFEMMNKEIEIKPVVFSQKVKKERNLILVMRGYILENQRILKFF